MQDQLVIKDQIKARGLFKQYNFNKFGQCNNEFGDSLRYLFIFLCFALNKRLTSLGWDLKLTLV